MKTFVICRVQLRPGSVWFRLLWNTWMAWLLPLTVIWT